MLKDKKRQAILKSLTTIVFVLGIIVLAACQSEATSTDVPVETREVSPETPPEETSGAALAESFTLLVGQSLTLDGTALTLTFEMVERDGRCPSAVDCAQNGPVVVVISAVSDDQTATDFTMNPDPNLAALFGMPPNIVTYGNYEIELTAVNPFPEEIDDLMNMAYEATLIVREKDAS